MKIETHNGKITITNPKGEHRTFRIRTMRGNFAKGSRVVELLTGPNNEQDYQGFGFINQVMDGIKVRVWKKHSESKLFRRFAELMENPNKFTKEGYIYQHEVKCRVCNRTLTTPESIELGIGPECRNKHD